MWVDFSQWLRLVPDAISWDKWLLAIIALAGFAFGVYQYRMRKRDKAEETEIGLEATDKHEERKKKKVEDSDERWYRRTLEKDLGSVRMLGLPGVDKQQVELLDTFVSLNISPTWRSEERIGGEVPQETHSLDPDTVMKRAFEKYNMLLVIGDPGSGKTTLMKYYTITCLEKEFEPVSKLGLTVPRLPIYFPLRELKDSEDGQLLTFNKQLSLWAEKRLRKITPATFQQWLQNKHTLILFDGLDEISSLDKRRRVCEWIKQTAEGLHKARFVVTSRWTGYRKADGIELECDHMRSDITDFTAEQQADFLRAWFPAAYCQEYRDPKTDPDADVWRENQRAMGLGKAEAIVEYLLREENKAIRELSGTPMLLQIMAIIWKEREFLPNGRGELYNSALIYMLQYRDARRKLDPLLPSKEAMLILEPLALWMQENLNTDEVEKAAFHERMQPLIDSIRSGISAEDLCANLRDRAGIIAEYGDLHYVFRHKSFREYLAGLELVKVCRADKTHFARLAERMEEDWWEEPLRFFMNESDGALFEGMMRAIFGGPATKRLSDKASKLLRLLANDARQRPVEALAEILKNVEINSDTERYLLDVMKQIDSRQARSAVQNFLEKQPDSSRARELVAEWRSEEDIQTGVAVEAAVFDSSQKSFLNPLEYNAEYILIPGGTYQYSVTQQAEVVPDIYFAKYPLTFKRYQRFIRYLSGAEPELQQQLSLSEFSRIVRQRSETVESLIDYLPPTVEAWAENCQSTYEDNKKFNGDDQPVVRITWFDARIYCMWLTALGGEGSGWIYDLPTEAEWEWAAGGGKRKYPWREKLDEPTDQLANYNGHVGATTPVGNYPEGATPEGLLDIAGNVWEWQKNKVSEGSDRRSLRGGSWLSVASRLRCSARSSHHPASRGSALGFRVVRRQLS